jgi:hypothetical protein
MNDYVYKDPLENGYKQFKLTKKQHNKLFKHRQMKWYDKYEYYYNDKEVVLHKFISWKGVIFETIMFPINLLINGLGNFKEIVDTYKKLYNQKEHGYFSSDNAYRGSDTYNKVMEVLNES